MRPEKVLAAVVLAARSVFASKGKTIVGTLMDTAVKGADGKVLISREDFPKVLIIGIASSLGVEKRHIQDLSCLDLGENNPQVQANFQRFATAYTEAAKLVGQVDWEDKVRSEENGMQRFILKHNLMCRKVHLHIAPEKTIPEFPYQFKRSKNE
jgi:hypothetical protein